MHITQTLQQAPLFAGLSEEQLQQLQGISQRLGFERGQTIFSEGSDAAGFYVVLSGRIKIFKLSLEGKEQILHIFGAGEPIGEVPVFAGQTFPANAEALDKAEVAFFPRKKLVGLYTSDPSLAMNMLAVLSQRLREFTRLIENLSLKEIPQRLAAYLVERQNQLPDSTDVTLDVSKGVLAKILGTSQETLSRILNKLTEAGIVQVNGRRIRILDSQQLEAVAEGDIRL